MGEEGEGKCVLTSSDSNGPSGDFKIVPSKDFSIIGGYIRTIDNFVRKMMIEL